MGVTRRVVIRRGIGVTGLTLLGADWLNTQHVSGSTFLRSGRFLAKRPKIRFTSIPLQTTPVPTIAPEYEYAVVLPWRERLNGSGRSFEREGLTEAQQKESVGIGHDGMWYSGSDIAGLLCINHEFGSNIHIFGRSEPSSLDDVRVSQAAHGVTIAAVAKGKTGTWRNIRSSSNRRITANTRMLFSGPGADSALVVNSAGNKFRGTFANCSNGSTPWGTYLTCEENFHSYFGANDSSWIPTPEQQRYGLSASGSGYGWHKFDRRFDLSASEFQNECNRFGWVVEIDPKDPTSRPTKRTGLGRFKHESATLAIGRGNRAVVYMGDDERFEYIYKFVSKKDWRVLIGEKKSPLDEGRLYVARFNSDGTGNWLELSNRNPLLADRTDDWIAVHARIAADIVGATKMDRPERMAIAPDGHVYCTLTNNSRRGRSGYPTVDAANPTTENPWGHIIRWKDARDHVGTSFRWNIFALAKDVVDENGQMFGSPDGIWVDDDGRVFIQTDGTQPGGANNQLLVTDTDGSIYKRLFTGVPGCEITGVATTPDRRTMFVNIQHPGGGSRTATNFPEEYTGSSGPVPRDATVVIRRKNGGIIGS